MHYNIEIINRGLGGMERFIEHQKGSGAIRPELADRVSQSILTMLQGVAEVEKPDFEGSPFLVKTEATRVLSDVANLVAATSDGWIPEVLKSFFVAMRELDSEPELAMFDYFLKMCEDDRVADDAIRGFARALDLFNLKDTKGTTLLHRTFEKGPLRAVQLLVEPLSLGLVDLYATNSRKYTPLHALASSHFIAALDPDQMAMIKGWIQPFLVELNPADLSNNTPLHAAVLCSNMNVLDLLRDADFSATNYQGETPLHICFSRAVDYQATSQMRQFIVMHTDAVNIKNNQGNTPLHLAIAKRNAILVDILLGKGADPTALNKKGQSPFFMALQVDQSDVVANMLLAAVGDINAVDAGGKPALDVAIENERWGMASVLISQGCELLEDYQYNGKSIWDYVLQSKSAYFLEAVATRLALPQQADENGVTFLMQVAATGNLGLYQKALSYGFSPLASDNDGQTVLEHAALAGSTEIVRYILTEDRAQNFVAHHERVFEIACRRHDLKLLRTIIAKKIYFETATIGGKSVLEYAIIHGETKLATFIAKLLEKTNRQNVLKDLICSNLELLVLVVDLEDQSLLLAFLSVFPFEDTPALTPLVQLLANKGHWDVIYVLINNNPDIFSLQVGGKPILHVAIDNQAFEFVEYCLEKKYASLTDPYNESTILEALVTAKHWEPINKAIKAVNSLADLGWAVDFEELLKQAVAQRADLTFIYILISKGVPFEGIRFQGQSLLHLFARADTDQALFDHFLGYAKAAGVNLNVEDEQGRTPVAIALQTGSIDKAVALIKSGAEMRFRDWNFALQSSHALTIIFEVANHHIGGDASKAQDPEFKENIELLLLAYFNKANYPVLSKKLDGVARYESLANDLYGFFNHYRDVTAPRVEIPDVIVDQNIFQSLQLAFDAFTDQELEGVMGIEERAVSPQKQRSNFRHFLHIVENDQRITGVPEDTEVKYGPIKRILRHLVIALPTLDRDTTLTLLTQLSRISSGYCIEPYMKATRWIYSVIQQSEQGAVVDAADAETDTRRRFVLKLAEWRDTALSEALEESKGVIDTHAANWVRKHFGDIIGVRFEEHDAHIDDWGLFQIKNFLGLPRNAPFLRIIARFQQKFRPFFMGFTFQSFARYVNQIFVSDAPHPVDDSVKEYEVLLDYFHTLVDMDKNEQLESLVAGHRQSNPRFVEFLTLDQNYNTLDQTLRQIKRDIGRLEMQKQTFERMVKEDDSTEVKEAKQKRIRQIEASIRDKKEELASAEQNLALQKEQLEEVEAEVRVLSNSYRRILRGAEEEHARIPNYVMRDESYTVTGFSQEGCFRLLVYIAEVERRGL